MEVFENSENKEFDIKLVDFPFICRICLRRDDLRLFEEEDYLLDLYETITKIDVRSTANLPKNICNDCIKTLENISSFINMSKNNDIVRQKKHWMIIKENAAVDNCGTSRGHMAKSDKTSGECGEDVYIKESEICRICSSTSCLTPFEEKAHLMQLFQNITNIDVEAETNFSKGNSICNKCIDELEKISLFNSLSFCNDMKLKNGIGRDQVPKTEDYLEEKAIDILSPTYTDIKFENILGRNDIKMENNFSENAHCYQRKDLHEVVDIKEELLHSSEPFVQGCDSSRNEFSSENGLKVIPKGSEVNLGARFITKKFQCDCCENSFSFESLLQQHMRVHTGEKPFKCDSCEKSFSRKHHLLDHMRIHTGEKPFKCDICEKGFSQKANLLKHTCADTTEKPFNCDTCGKRFSWKSRLREHMRIHTGDKPFKCDICERSFSRKQHLLDHMRIHTAEKPFRCEYCKERFTLKQNFKRHLLTHSGKKTFGCDSCVKRKVDLLNRAEEKPFDCDCRKKSFPRNHSLTRTEEKPFGCHNCEKSFRQKSTLRWHMRSHAGERPFKCDSCEQSFSRKQHLLDHMRVHTGEKPFKCINCKKSFSQMPNLQKHMRTHSA